MHRIIYFENWAWFRMTGNCLPQQYTIDLVLPFQVKISVKLMNGFIVECTYVAHFFQCKSEIKDTLLFQKPCLSPNHIFQWRVEIVTSYGVLWNNDIYNTLNSVQCQAGIKPLVGREAQLLKFYKDMFKVYFQHFVLS